MSSSAVSTVHDGPILPERATLGPASVTPYELHDFLDDQRRLILSAKRDPSLQIRSVQGFDGGMLVIPLAPSLESVRTHGNTAREFWDKYGPGTGTTRLTQFCRVLKFLEDSRTEIANAGLADDREPMTVLAEFARFLLNWKVDRAPRRIPERALIRFLDEWGHRWI